MKVEVKVEVEVKVKDLFLFLQRENLIPERYLIRKFEQWQGLLPELYRNEHSWAGDQGCVAWIITSLDLSGISELSAGGWYSDNGRITRDDPNIPCAEAIVRADGKVGDILVIRKWNYYDNPIQEFEDFYYRKITEEDLERGKQIIAELENREV